MVKVKFITGEYKGETRVIEHSRALRLKKRKVVEIVKDKKEKE